MNAITIKVRTRSGAYRTRTFQVTSEKIFKEPYKILDYGMVDRCISDFIVHNIPDFTRIVSYIVRDKAWGNMK